MRGRLSQNSAMNPSSTPGPGAERPLLHVRDARGVHTLTLNTPNRFNVLGEAMLGALESALVEVRADPQARVLVLAAAGKAFCAGHDLKEMKTHPDAAYFQGLFARCSRLMLSLQQLPVPVIAKVQGLATAAGCQLVAQCDLAVSVDTARFGVNGIDAGLFCATPSVPLVRNMAPKLAMEMLVTGEFIDAPEARARGLVNRVVTAAELDRETEGLVVAILARPREALAMGKQLFYQQREMGVAAAYQLASQTMACNMVHPVAQEGVQAFIDKREPQWPT